MADISLLDENVDFTKLKVPDLKRELKLRGLSTSGNKIDLLERLQNSLKSKQDDAISAESVDDLDEDLLNDDDLDHDQLDASESVLKELDEQLDVSPRTKDSKRKTPDSSFESKPTKKIVLNRNQSVIDSSLENLNEKNIDIKTSPIESSNGSEEKKTVKLSELSSKERLEMRAKKFGNPASDDAKKIARAQRFSSESSTSVTNSSDVIKDESVTIDALKKRAERFGGSVSTVMSSLEQQERIEKRKARFGAISTNGATQDEKAKRRLERFKTPIK